MQDVYGCFDLATLETLRDRYAARGDLAKAQEVRAAIGRHGAVQTLELSNCGKLFAHESARDNTGRITTSWTGDNLAWMSAFMTGSRIGKVNVALAKEAACRQTPGSAT